MILILVIVLLITSKTAADCGIYPPTNYYFNVKKTATVFDSNYLPDKLIEANWCEPVSCGSGNGTGNGVGIACSICQHQPGDVPPAHFCLGYQDTREVRQLPSGYSESSGFQLVLTGSDSQCEYARMTVVDVYCTTLNTSSYITLSGNGTCTYSFNAFLNSTDCQAFRSSTTQAVSFRGTDSRSAGIATGTTIGAIMVVVVPIAIILYKRRKKRNKRPPPPVSPPLDDLNSNTSSPVSGISTNNSEDYVVTPIIQADSSGGEEGGREMSVILSVDEEKKIEIPLSPSSQITFEHAAQDYTEQNNNNAVSVNSIISHALDNLKHSGPVEVIQYSDIEFKGKLGAGSSGKVYKAIYQGKQIAVKVLEHEVREFMPLEELESVEMFCKELEIMSAVQTPHSVYFYGAVVEPKLCMVMEYCSKGSLYHVLTSPKYKLEWEQLFHYAIEATTGIKELHDLNPQIVHRDVKSLNFLVTDIFEVKVCDFGLSRFNTGSNMSTLQKLRGTYAYCAPEVYNAGLYSTKSDVYSMGIVFWELVVRCIRGQYEWPYAEYKEILFDFQIIFQAAKMGLRPTIPESCPESLKRLILSCIDGNAENRPTCDAVLQTLMRLRIEWAANRNVWDAAIIPKVKPDIVL